MEVTLVPHEHIEMVWPKIESYMKGAADYTYGRFTVDNIKKDLLEKPDSQQLWIAFNSDGFYGAVITELWQYPQIKTLIMHFTGGKKLLKWKQPMLELLQKFARDNDCEIIESYGRRDGKKYLNKMDIKNNSYFMNYLWSRLT